MQDKFSDRGLGQGINKNFQEGDMGRDYFKIFRRGKCTGRNVNNYRRGYDQGVNKFQMGVVGRRVCIK